MTKKLKPLLYAAATCVAFISTTLLASAQDGVAIPDKTAREASREVPRETSSEVKREKPRETLRGVRPQPASVPTATAPRTPEPVLAPTLVDNGVAERNEHFVGLAVGGQLIRFGDNNVKGGFLYGASLQAGCYFSTDIAVLKNMLLFADIGLYSGGWTDTLLDMTVPYGESALPSWDFVHSTLKRKSELMSIPMLVTLAYDFRPCDSLSLKIGPSVGITYASVKSKFDSQNDISTNDGEQLTTLYDSANVSGAKMLLSYGVTLGASWVFAKNWSADLQYRFQGSSKLKLDESLRDYGSSSAHQFNLGVSYRF